MDNKIQENASAAQVKRIEELRELTKGFKHRTVAEINNDDPEMLIKALEYKEAMMGVSKQIFEDACRKVFKGKLWQK